jgi:hypothetical protein
VGARVKKWVPKKKRFPHKKPYCTDAASLPMIISGASSIIAVSKL